MDDDDDDDAADGVNDSIHATDSGARGDDRETVNLIVATKKQPQERQLLMLHDADDDNDDDADGDDEEEVLLQKNPHVIRNGNTKCKHSEESSESVSDRSSRTSSQPPLVNSHIVPATPTRRAATTTSTSTSPLKSTTRLPHEEADDICLVPEIDFEGMSTDAGSDNRESQPLLGGGGGGGSHSRISDLLGALGRGHDHVDLVSNTFGGKFPYREFAHSTTSKSCSSSCGASHDNDVCVNVCVNVCMYVCVYVCASLRCSIHMYVRVLISFSIPHICKDFHFYVLSFLHMAVSTLLS